MSIYVNLQDISKYRSELMGLATIMIIVCHSVPFGVQMPDILSRIFTLGNLGVDVFLFLSGVGLYYSLSRVKVSDDLLTWYRKRFVRILLPYLVIVTPCYAYSTISNDHSIWYFLYLLSTASFWTEHLGMWFIALMIPLYLITPFVYGILRRYDLDNVTGGCIASIVVVVLYLLCYIMPDYDSPIADNVFGAVARSSIFFFGLGLGGSVKRAVFGRPGGVNSVALTIICVVGYVLLKMMNINLPMLLAIPVILLLVHILN